ncbi:unnamed protein product [Paramecium pentaurelia]|uniref:Uncharacterized protein n=1 Tax=Paramecium pentaurelia TaxID=43138 RepID=A0A8S1UIT0_9CILI|nr:unnamed protein product [Paramecium pentaurelia]
MFKFFNKSINSIYLQVSIENQFKHIKSSQKVRFKMFQEMSKEHRSEITLTRQPQMNNHFNVYLNLQILIHIFQVSQFNQIKRKFLEGFFSLLNLNKNFQEGLNMQNLPLFLKSFQDPIYIRREFFFCIYQILKYSELYLNHFYLNGIKLLCLYDLEVSNNFILLVNLSLKLPIDRNRIEALLIISIIFLKNILQVQTLFYNLPFFSSMKNESRQIRVKFRSQWQNYKADQAECRI